MKRLVIGLAGLVLVAGCAKAPANTASSGAAAPAASPPSSVAANPAAPTSGPPVSGAYTVDGKPSVLTSVTAHKGDPFDGKPVTELVFSAKDQGGDAQAAEDALFGKFGDAVIARVEPDGTVIGVDLVHAGLKEPGSVSIAGMVSVKNFQTAGGQVAGELTTGGPTDVFDQQVNLDLVFHAPAP